MPRWLENKWSHPRFVCVYLCECVLVAQLCLTLCSPPVLTWRIPGTGESGGLLSVGSHRVGHDWSDLAAAAGSSFHRILQARILTWDAIPFSRGSSWPRDWIWVSCIAGKFFTVWVIREAQDLYHPKTCGPKDIRCHEPLASAPSVRPGPMINQTSPTPCPLDPMLQLFG